MHILYFFEIKGGIILNLLKFRKIFAVVTLVVIMSMLLCSVAFAAEDAAADCTDYEIGRASCRERV